MEQDKDSLISEGKRESRSHAKAILCHLPPADRCPASLWARATLEWPSLCWATCHMALNIPLANSGQLSHVFPLPTFCHPLIYSLGVGRMRDRGPTLCKHCSAAAKPLVCHRHRNLANARHGTIPAAAPRQPQRHGLPRRSRRPSPAARLPAFTAHSHQTPSKAAGDHAKGPRVWFSESRQLSLGISHVALAKRKEQLEGEAFCCFSSCRSAAKTATSSLKPDSAARFLCKVPVTQGWNFETLSI